jgi:hypothetical protein
VNGSFQEPLTSGLYHGSLIATHDIVSLSRAPPPANPARLPTLADGAGVAVNASWHEQPKVALSCLGSYRHGLLGRDRAARAANLIEAMGIRPPPHANP